MSRIRSPKSLIYMFLYLKKIPKEHLQFILQEYIFLSHSLNKSTICSTLRIWTWVQLNSKKLAHEVRIVTPLLYICVCGCVRVS